MKRVKTESRNRMNTQTLDKLLRVRLEASGETSLILKKLLSVGGEQRNADCSADLIITYK